MEVYFLTCGIRAWFENIGFELTLGIVRVISQISLKLCLKEWKVARELRLKNLMARILSFGSLKLKISL
jgi:hypothetical protein